MVSVVYRAMVRIWVPLSVSQGAFILIGDSLYTMRSVSVMKFHLLDEGISTGLL
jgi:hypothetical protein